MPSPLLYLVSALAYALLAGWFWRAHWRRTQADAKTPPQTLFEPLYVAFPWLAHGALLYAGLFAPQGLNLGLGVTISMIAWLTVLIYTLINWRHQLEGLQSGVLVIGAIGVLMPFVLPTSHTLVHSNFLLFKAHLLIAFLAYSLLMIAALHALLMTVAEHGLHRHASGAPVMRTLPPLLTMESWLFRIISVGFVLLSLTLISGMVFSEELFAAPLTVTHKTVFAIISWLIFAALLAGRFFYGWRGRVAVRWTLAGFVALLLAYLGSRFVLEVVLGRA